MWNIHSVHASFSCSFSISFPYTILLNEWREVMEYKVWRIVVDSVCLFRLELWIVER